MSSPRAAFKDLKALISQRGSEQIWGLAMALLVTAIILVIFTVDPKVNTAPPQQVVYVENYGPDRTDAQIKADQQKDSAKRKAQKDEKKRQFKELQDKLGIE